MKLYCLGTGHADVTKNYNTCFVLENGGGDCWLTLAVETEF